VPEEPRREGRAVPNVIPYVVLVVAGLACWFVMKEFNTPYRDDEIYAQVTHEPVEPRFLRAYLVDPRNTRHREQVYSRLEGFYSGPVSRVRAEGGDPDLREGMAQVLDSLKRADQPVVSIRVTEKKSPPGKEAGAADRAKQVSTRTADRIIEVLRGWAPPVTAPAGMVFKEQPPPIGEQLIAFVEAPEESKPHFDISYEFVPDGANRYTIRWTAAIRTDVEKDPVKTKTVTESRPYTADALDSAVNDLKDAIARALVGSGGGPAPAPKMPVFPQFP